MSLGPPIRPEPEPGPQWVLCEDKRFERHVVTGRLRTRIPENELANLQPFPWPNYGVVDVALP